MLKQFRVLPELGENDGQQGSISRKSTDLVSVSHDSAFHLSDERLAFYMVRYTTLIFEFSCFLLLLSLLNTYYGLWLTCLFLFMCTVTLVKEYFSNLAIRAVSSQDGPFCFGAVSLSLLLVFLCLCVLWLLLSRENHNGQSSQPQNFVLEQNVFSSGIGVFWKEGLGQRLF